MKKHKRGDIIKKGKELSRKYWLRCSCPSCVILKKILTRKYKLDKIKVFVKESYEDLFSL